MPAVALSTASVASDNARELRPSAIWTMMGTWGIFAAISIMTGSIWDVLHATGAFVTGNLAAVEHLGERGLSSFSFLTAMLTLMLPIGILSGVLVSRFGTAKSNKSVIENKARTATAFFAILMVTLIAEELFARGLFLGLLSRLFAGSSAYTAAYYVLFLVGNGLWALVHLFNFKDSSERKVFMVLPQFTVGVMLTVTFAAYGLLAALIVHIAYDMLLFSHDRIDRFNLGEIGVIAYNALVAGVSFLAFNQHLTDVGQWLTFDGRFVLTGWSVWDYFWGVLLLRSILTILAELLLYDFEPVAEMAGVLPRLIAPPLVTGLMFLSYWLFGLVIDDVAWRLFIITVALLLVGTTLSGSGLARMFWEFIPSTMLMLCACFAVGFWYALLFVTIYSVINIPEEIIRRKDTD